VRIRVRPLIVTVLIAAATSGAGPSSATARPVRPTGLTLAADRGSTQRPNILLIVSDDQAWSTFSRALMPSTYGDLVDHGVLFTRAYDETSECCPSRSEILTGLHEHHTGVDNNFVPLHRPTIVEALHDRGYRTMLAGKYLNSLPCTPRPEFDRWVCAGSPPSSYSLVDPYLNVDGTWTHFPGQYQTDVLAGRVKDFVAATPADRPFFAMYTPTTPHLPGNDDRYAGMPVAPWRPPSFDEDTRADGKPQYLHRPPLEPGEIETIDRDHAVMSRAVRSFDDSVGTILDGLGDRAANTMVIYISDNGYLYGEHRLEGKGVPYEESVRVPMIIRYPPDTDAIVPKTSRALVANIDLAPTIADLAGFAWGADGKSLVPVLSGQVAGVRSAVLLSRCNGVSGPCIRYPGYWGVVTAGRAYIRYSTGEEELYDLRKDPYELRNQAHDPQLAATKARLRKTLNQLRAPPAVQTTIVSGPRGATPSRLVTFRYFAQSRLATYTCGLIRDDGLRRSFPCGAQTMSLGPLPSGSYLFSVTATDERGSRDPTPAMRRFVIAGPDSGPVISVGNARATEGTGTARAATFRVTVRPTPTSTISVRYTTVGGSARPASDFASRSGTLTFGAGATSRNLFVRLVPDAVHEPDEDFRLVLSSPHGAYLVVPVATATIVDDDTYGFCTITGTPGPNILKGTPGDDVICALGGNDILVGQGGNDVLLGGDGNDLLLGGGGTDVLDGGAGVDTASYSSAGVTGGVTVSLVAATASGPALGRDWFAMAGPQSSVESVDGTPFADRLTGDSGTNVLLGEGGDDTLLGGSGDDRLFGGPGNDRLLGGDGQDTLVPGVGTDRVLGGEGTDGVSYGDVTGGGVNIDLAAGTASGRAVRDLLAGVENAAGTPADDVLRGTARPNTLSGDAGNDRLLGNGEADVLIGGAGQDTLSGGAGDDTAAYTFAVGGMTVNLSALPERASGGDGSDALKSIERVVGSSFDDVLTGGSGPNSLSGGPGNDRLYGGDGIDSLQGGPGNDLLDGGPSFDHCFDNLGHDVLMNCETFDVAAASLLAQPPAGTG
jgi:arylsulfatase A-like enzyme/Ca2+-binding RTX toxin-like protein